MAVTPDHDVAVAAGFMVLCATVSGVELRTLDLATNALEVRVDEVGSQELVLIVFESELVFTLLWHFHPDFGLVDAFAVLLVARQEVLSP